MSFTKDKDQVVCDSCGKPCVKSGPRSNDLSLRMNALFLAQNAMYISTGDSTHDFQIVKRKNLVNRFQPTARAS